MDFTISEEDRLLQQSVRSFVEERANAVWKEIEKTAEIPQHLIDGMKELGLFGLSYATKLLACYLGGRRALRHPVEAAGKVSNEPACVVTANSAPASS